MRTTLSLLFLLLKSFDAFSQETKYQNTDSLLADLNILTTTIRENHPMMNAYISIDKFDMIADRMAIQMRNGVTPSAFYYSVSQLVHSIRCGHTYVYPTAAAENRLVQINDLPFDIVMMDTSVYISVAHQKDYEPYAGKEIFRINDVPLSRLISAAFNFINADGLNVTYKKYTLQQKFRYYLNIMLGNPDSLVFESSGGNFTVLYPTHFNKPPNDELETSFHALADVPYSVLLTVPDFDDGKKEIKKCFRYMQEHKTEQLIIDLRENSGGNGNIGAELVSFTIDTSLTYYLDKKTAPLRYKEYMHDQQGMLIGNRYIQTDSLTRSYYFDIKPKEKYNFNGQVYVITNGGTFSTGAFVASALKHKAGAICVGEETGGSEYAIGGGVIARLELPYSHIKIQFPLYKWRFNVVAKDLGTGVIPDIRIRKNLASLLSGQDQEMIKVTDLIRQQSRNLN